MNLNLITSKYVTIEDLERIQELDKLRFPNRVYKNYIYNTNCNNQLTYKEAKRKIIRNIILGEKMQEKEGIEYKDVYFYGNLIIQINKEENSICYIKMLNYIINVVI